MPVVRSLKTLKTRALAAVSPQLGALKGTPVVYMQDGVNIWGVQPGYPAYGAYYNGTYANVSGMRARFPGAYIVSITPDGLNGAMCIDIEPGDAIPADAPGFWHNSNHGGAVKPWFYASAGSVRAVIDNLSAAGIPRSAYFIWSAHYIGNHICGPGTCGYPQADGTQYATTQNYDISVLPAYMIGTVPPPVTEPTIAKGSTNVAAVEKLRVLLDSHNAQLPANADGGPGKFGDLVFAAVEAFQVVNNLTKDGIVGPATWASLLNKNSKPIPEPPTPPTPVPAPANLDVNPVVIAKIEWAPVKGATKYVVLVADQGTGTVTSVTSTTNSAPVKVRIGRTYKVTVRADVAGSLPAYYTLTV